MGGSAGLNLILHEGIERTTDETRIDVQGAANILGLTSIGTYRLLQRGVLRAWRNTMPSLTSAPSKSVIPPSTRQNRQNVCAFVTPARRGNADINPRLRGGSTDLTGKEDRQFRLLLRVSPRHHCRLLTGLVHPPPVPASIAPGNLLAR